MSGTFEENLDRLAKLLVWASGATPGCHVLVTSRSGCEQLTERVVTACHKLGVSRVECSHIDHHELRDRLRLSSAAERNYFSEEERQKWQRLYEKKGHLISVSLDYEPSLFADLGDELTAWKVAYKEMRGDAFERGVLGGELPWTLFYQPQPEVAAEVFPDVSAEEAVSLYWDQLFAVVGADKDDAVAFMKASNAALKRRQDKLNALKIRKVHFWSPNGTDFTVGLSTQARWVGGEKTAGNGARHTANLPTYEVFTTPDWRTVQGNVRMTRPNLISGMLAEDVLFRFQDGKLCSLDGTNVNTLRKLVQVDEGSSRLGELALVGVDSPVFQSGLVFRTVILDENAACHFAVGSAYGTCIEGFPEMDAAAKAAIGFNESKEHRDFMISDESTLVTATTYSGELVTLMEDGAWTKKFL